MDYAKQFQRLELRQKLLETKIDKVEIATWISMMVTLLAIIVLGIVFIRTRNIPNCDIYGHTLGCQIDGKFYPVRTKEDANKIKNMLNHD